MNIQTIKPNQSLRMRWLLVSLMAVLVLLLAACQPAAPAAIQIPVMTEAPSAAAEEPVSAEPAIMPSVMVSDQEIVDGKVMIAEVVSDGPAWLVIHAQADGKPGPVLGFAAVTDGLNQNVMVEIDVTQATETLYAMLHTDAGTLGQYEFPGDDVPVKVDDQVVTPAFVLLQDMATETTTVFMDKTGFATKELIIPVGTTVVWVNNSSASHTVTADDGLFDSGNMREGATFEYTFTKAGEYPYYCLYHGSAGGNGMAGTIIVTDS